MEFNCKKFKCKVFQFLSIVEMLHPNTRSNLLYGRFPSSWLSPTTSFMSLQLTKPHCGKNLQTYSMDDSHRVDSVIQPPSWVFISHTNCAWMLLVHGWCLCMHFPHCLLEAWYDTLHFDLDDDSDVVSTPTLCHIPSPPSLSLLSSLMASLMILHSQPPT